MLFALPRFGLEFELLPSGQLRSLDYRGFALGSCQQLVNMWGDGAIAYTLPDFDQFLVLDKYDASGRLESQRVVVPHGRVERGRGHVAIQHASGCGATIQVRAVSVDL